MSCLKPKSVEIKGILFISREGRTTVITTINRVFDTNKTIPVSRNYVKTLRASLEL